MNFMIHRQGQDYGPYTLEQIKELLANGTVSESDLAWPEGGSAWIPLQNIILPAGGGLPTALIPSSDSATPENKGSDLNGYFVGCLLVAGGLILSLMLVLLFLPIGLGRIVVPVYKAGPVSVNAFAEGNYAEFAEEVDGDVASIDMKTDYTQEKLRDEVMEHIYSMATENPSVTKFKMTIHETGGLAQKEAVLEMDDLEEVRKFTDKRAYAQSSDRSRIDAKLKEAGL